MEMNRAVAAIADLKTPLTILTRMLKEPLIPLASANVQKLLKVRQKRRVHLGRLI